MRKLISFAAVLVLLTVSTATAQVRGKGRIQGVVTDQATGQPIKGAKVTIAMTGSGTQPIVATSDAKGRWSALGLVGGVWNIDIEASGYQTSRGTANVSEIQMMPAIKTELVPAVVEETTIPFEGSSVPPAAVAAIQEAQALMTQQVGDVATRSEATAEGAAGSVPHTLTEDDVRANAVRAAELLERAIPQLPADTPELQRVRVQARQLLAQAYYKTGDVKRAIEALESVVTADPANQGAALLLVNLYLEDGRLDDARQRLEKMPANAVTDPTIYLNVGILFLNKSAHADAVVYFDRAIALDTERAESYYYRGLANLQSEKHAAAKADFERVVALAPDSPEARDAKQLLPSLK